MQYVSGRRINQDFGIPGITTNDTVVNVDGRIAVGIGTSATTDIDTNQIRIRDNIIDSRGVIGSMGYFLTKDVEGVTWTNVPPLGNNSIFLAEDGDILNNIGLQTYTGLNIISDQLLGITTNPDNPGFADIRIDPRWFRDRTPGGGGGIYTTGTVGIGLTQPRLGPVGVLTDVKLDVLGDAIFTGVVSATSFTGEFNVDTKDLKVSGIATFTNIEDNTLGIVTTGAVQINGGVGIAKNVSIGQTLQVGSAVTIGNGNVSAFDGDFVNLNVSGISTFGDRSRFNSEVSIFDDLFVSGNVFVGGTSVTLETEIIRIEGKELLIGFSTTFSPNDTTANAAGIAVASTEGYFLADLQVPGINTTPNTYKQFKWFKDGTFVGQGTDAFISNQPISIGRTQIGNGQLFAVGNNINFTEEEITTEDLKVNRTALVGSAISMSGGIVTATTFDGDFLSVEDLNVTGIATINTGIVTDLKVSGVSTFVGIATFGTVAIGTTNVIGGDKLSIIGDARLGGVNDTLRVGSAISMSAGIVTATTFDGNFLTIGDLNVTGIATINTGIVTNLNVTGVSTINSSNVTDLNVTGIATINTGIVTDLSVSGIATINTGIVTDLKVSGVSTFVGLSTFGTVGIGTTNVIGSDKLTIIGDARLGGVNDTLRVGSAISMSAGIITALKLEGEGGTIIDISGGGTVITGIVTIGESSITLDGTNGTESIVIGSGITLSAVSDSTFANSVDINGDLDVSGISTLGTVKISSGIITSTTGTGVTYYGDGQYLENIITGVGIQSSGTVIGTEFTTLNFIGTGNTIVGVGNTVNISINSSEFAGFAQTAGIATNLSGGAGGQVVYQSATDTTAFLSNGTVGQVLVSNGGTNAPQWADGASTGAIDGITIQDEGSIVGSGGSVSILNFEGSAITATASGNISTITVTIPSIPDVNGSAGIASTARDVIGGIGSLSSLSVTGISTLGTVEINSGVITATTGIVTYYGDGQYLDNIITDSEISNQSVAFAQTAGIATEATRLQTARTFEITGDVVASPISFNGTGNVSLAATIQPNSVALGDDTTGDYVQSISGTANQITVTGGSGESSTPIISIPNNPTLPGNVTVQNDLTVNGNLLIVGAGATLIVDEFRVSDKNVVVGVTTDSGGNDVSSDTTANGGGIAIASTVGNPLVDLSTIGIDTHPSTYKRLYWYQSGSGLGTDAWLSNYAFGIGSTQFPTGTYFAAGNVQITENDLAAVRNINSSGVVTATTFSGNLTGTASTASFATTAFNLNGVVESDLNVATATTATNLANAANITTGTINADRLTGSYGISITGAAATASFATTAFSLNGIVESDLNVASATTATNLANAANITTGTINADRLSGSYGISITGAAATASFATTAFSLNGVVESDLNVATAVTATNSTNVIVADESTDATCFPLFVTAATGNLAPKSGTNLTFNSSDGTLTATDFNTTSDENLKTNIHTIEDPLAKVVHIRGVNFDWKETQKPSVGVIAQEVEKVLPELVASGDKKTVNYNGLIGLLIEVVKEQQTQINSLNDRLSKLE